PRRWTRSRPTRSGGWRWASTSSPSTSASSGMSGRSTTSRCTSGRSTSTWIATDPCAASGGRRGAGGDRCRSAIELGDVDRAAGVLAGDARGHCRFGDGGRNELYHSLVEHARDDVLLVQLVLADHRGDGARRGQVHLLVDRGGVSVQ